MNTIATTAIWAIVTLILFGSLMRYLSKPLAGLLETVRVRQELANKATEITTLERKNAADLAQKTANDQLALQKAQMRQQAAEADAAAEIAQATIAARIREEEQVIAARAEGRALTAKDRASNGPTDESALAILMDAYKTYRNTGGSCDLEDWIGDLRLVNGELVDA